MINQTIILTTKAELESIVENALKTALNGIKPIDEPKPQTIEKTLLNSRELAKKLKCSYQTVWNHTNAGKIPFIKNNRTYLYDLDLVVQSMSRNHFA